MILLQLAAVEFSGAPLKDHEEDEGGKNEDDTVYGTDGAIPALNEGEHQHGEGNDAATADEGSEKVLAERNDERHAEGRHHSRDHHGQDHMEESLERSGSQDSGLTLHTGADDGKDRDEDP